jgi:hypothetical protein
MGSGLDLETVKVTDLETVKGWGSEKATETDSR